MTVVYQIGITLADRARLQKMERELRMPLQWGMGGENGALNDLHQRISINADFLLDVVDWCLKELDPGDEVRAVRVKVQLEEAGSAWTVGVIGDDFALVRRVD